MGLYIDLATELLKEAAGGRRAHYGKGQVSKSIVEKPKGWSPHIHEPRPQAQKPVASLSEHFNKPIEAARAEAKKNVPSFDLGGNDKPKLKPVRSSTNFSVGRNQPPQKLDLSLDPKPGDALAAAKASLGHKPSSTGEARFTSSSLPVPKGVTSSSLPGGGATGSTPWHRNPYNIALGLAGLGLAGGAGLYGIHSLYAKKKLKEKQQQSQSQLNPNLVKMALSKIADTAMRNPTAGGMYNVPAAPTPGAPPAPPAAQQQPASSVSQPTGSTNQSPQTSLSQTWRQTASDNLAQNMQGNQQQQSS